MTDPTCRCGRPIPDTAYICPACSNQLRKALEFTAALAGEHETTIARLDKVQRHGQHEIEHEWWREPGALYPMPLLPDLDKSLKYQVALGDLTTWARHIAETRGAAALEAIGGRTPALVGSRGQSGPVMRCAHATCAAIRAGQLSGPICPDRNTEDSPSGPVRSAALLIAANLDWARYRPESEELWPVLLAACSQLRRIVDTNPERVVGVCGCDRRLYADRLEGTVRCWGCGLEHDIAERFGAMMDAARTMRVQPADAADWIAWTDPNANREKVRGLVRQWAFRGLIEAGEDGRYQMGAILDRWTRALAARVA